MFVLETYLTLLREFSSFTWHFVESSFYFSSNNLSVLPEIYGIEYPEGQSYIQQNDINWSFEWLFVYGILSEMSFSTMC